MKKFLSIILAACMLLLLAACGVSEQPEQETTMSVTEITEAEPLDLESLHRQGDEYARAGQYEEALNCYQKMVELGDTYGMLYTASMYSTFLKDYVSAVEWLEKGAEAGNTGCMRELGHMYEHGEGVEQNVALAEEWYQKADMTRKP